MTLESTFASVGIIGCGWLGTPLARALLDRNIDVFATRSSIENVAVLTEQGIKAQALLLPVETSESIEKLSQHQVFKQNNLIIAITPQFRQGRSDYGEKIAQLVSAAKTQGCVNRIILLSSSAIYNGLCGEVTEESSLDFSADKVQLLHEAEQAVLDFSLEDCSIESNNRKSYVLRLAGLVGPNRHPGNFLKNGRMLKSPDAKVNLIHQQDALGLICSLLGNNTSSGIFNGVSNTHVSKKSYYEAAAKALSLPYPQFEEDDLSTSVRTVSGLKAQQVLSYQFAYHDLLTWL